MTEILTQTRVEDAVANTDAFLHTERGVGIDGDYASHQVSEYVNRPGSLAEQMLTTIRHPQYEGWYMPLSKHSANWYDIAVTHLPGHVVLVPSGFVDAGNAAGSQEFYPAVVSEDSLKTKNLRLHVLKQPYRQQMQYGTAMVLSAAGQSETKGIGAHGTKATDGVEAEHFATLLAAGTDERVQAAWQQGQHINHSWRGQTSNSVTSEVSKRLFGAEIPQATVTITRQQIETGRAMLLWHEGLRNEQTGKPETATKDKALVVIQGLGYEALRASNPSGLDVVKRLIS